MAIGRLGTHYIDMEASRELDGHVDNGSEDGDQNSLEDSETPWTDLHDTLS